MGGVLGTFIDWRGYPTVHAAATAAGLDALNVVVWSKTKRRDGQPLPERPRAPAALQERTAAHVNNVELGRHGRGRSNVKQTAMLETRSST